MALDPPAPTPPDITNRGLPAALEADAGDDLRRDDIEEILLDGAWQEAVDEWEQYTDLSASDIELAEERGLFHGLDFFWDGNAGRLRYVVPRVPEEWDSLAGPDGIDAGILQTELDDLGRIVAETIMTDYVDWGDGESSDFVWDVPSFGQMPTGEGE